MEKNETISLIAEGLEAASASLKQKEDLTCGLSPNPYTSAAAGFQAAAALLRERLDQSTTVDAVDKRRVYDGVLLLGEHNPVNFVASPNFGGHITPKFVIMHATGAGDMAGSIAHMSNPDNEVSSHLITSRGGATTQLVNFNKRAWHAGRSRWNEYIGMNSHSIGYELCNWGHLTYDDGYFTWTGKRIHNDDVVIGRHPNRKTTRGWERYPEAQFIEAARNVRAICDHYDIPAENILGHDQIAPARKTDPGPAFDMERFRELVFAD